MQYRALACLALGPIEVKSEARGAFDGTAYSQLTLVLAPALIHCLSLYCASTTLLCHCSTVQCHCDARQYSTVECSVSLALWLCGGPHSYILHATVRECQSSSTPCSTLPYSVLQYCTLLYCTILYCMFLRVSAWTG